MPKIQKMFIMYMYADTTFLINVLKDISEINKFCVAINILGI